MYAYIILHYKVSSPTIDAINSIKNIKGHKKIVVVDNNSNNGSFENVKRAFDNDSDIYFLHNKRNLGFAKGNNIGYEFAKKNLNSDVIVCLNNDVEIQNYAFQDILNQYLDKNIHIIGPNIINLEGVSQNPTQKKIWDIKDINRVILKYRILRFINSINAYRLIDIFKLYSALRKQTVETRSYNRSKQARIIEKDELLHGACVIFMPPYVKKEKYAFFPDTFLYMEEDILKTLCDIKGYTLVYDPNLLVMHKEDLSTNEVTKSKRKKREFIFKNSIESLKKYKGILKKQKIL